MTLLVKIYTFYPPHVGRKELHCIQKEISQTNNHVSTGLEKSKISFLVTQKEHKAEKDLLDC